MPGPTLSSVKSALAVLSALREHHELGVVEVAEIVGVGRSTAHRLLRTLKDAGYVRQSNPSRKYRLGPMMGATMDQETVHDYIAAAQGPMKALSTSTGETVHLAMLRGSDIFFPSAVVPDRSIKVSGRVGGTFSAHCSCAGKVLLASQSHRAIERLFPDERLETFTTNTISRRSTLVAQLEATRVLGYGRNIMESESDLVSLAVPIPEPTGPPVMALTIAAPFSRLKLPVAYRDNEDERQLVKLLREHAADIAAALN